MSRHTRVIALAAAALFGTWFQIPAAAQQPKTARDRVYSDPQAARGRTLYADKCASCHGPALQGDSAPPLTGDEFIAQWGAQPLADLVNKIQRTMPQNDPGKLSREQSTDLVAYLLQTGKFPAGQAELASSEAAQKAITMAGQTAVRVPPVAPAVGHAPSFPAAGNLAQVMRGILFPSSNLIFNVQTHDPNEV
jgi:mono/diheme cytochrome c family protein